MSKLGLQLSPADSESKCWVAEITGADEVYILKRDFIPAEPEGGWILYDGWYQLNGAVPGVTEFKKEYIRIKDGKVRRNLPFRELVESLDEIKAGEGPRVERMRREIIAILDEIKEAAYCEPGVEGIEKQKEDLDMADEPDQIKNALYMLKKQKQSYIQQYRKMFNL